MSIFKSHIRRDGLNRHPKAKLLALGGILFSLGVVTSVTATYAWYTINVLETIPNLNVKIISDQDIDFSLKMDLEQRLKEGEASPNIIHYDDRLDENGNFTGFTLEDMQYDEEGLHDVSGMYQSEWLDGANPLTDKPKFRTHYGAVPGSANPKPSVLDEGQGYLQTVLWLTASEDCYIYLSKVVDEDGKDKAIVTSADTDEKLQQVVNTVRLSFYSDDGYKIAYQQDSGDFRDTYYGGLLDMNGDGYYDYYDGQEVFYGEYENPEAVIACYADSNGGELPYDENMRDTFHANHADVKYLPSYKPGVVDESFGVKKEESKNIYEYIYDENEPMRPLEEICKLKANTPKRLVFTVYCEGWDLDMTDKVNKASFNINVGFTALLYSGQYQ